MKERKGEKTPTNKKIFPHWLSKAREIFIRRKGKESKVILLIFQNQRDGNIGIFKRKWDFSQNLYGPVKINLTSR